MSRQSVTDEVNRTIPTEAITLFKEKLENELARSPLINNASAALGAKGLAIGALGVTAAPVAAPIVAVAAGAMVWPYLRQALFGDNKSENAQPHSTQTDASTYQMQERIEEHIVKIAKKAESDTIKELEERYKNVDFLNTRPTNKVTKAQIGANEAGIKALAITDPETFTDKLQNYCEQRGCSSDEARLVAKFAGAFAESEMYEEFRVLSAARDLRTQFHLTPKPSVPWGQRKKLGEEVILRDVLGNYAPDLPFRDKSLADLNHEEWWTAFYKEDAEAGRINDQYFKDNDAAFRRGFAKSLGQGSLSSIIHPTDHEARLSSLAEILGTDQSEKAQRFVIPGNTRSRPQTSFTKGSLQVGGRMTP